MSPSLVFVPRSISFLGIIILMVGVVVEFRKGHVGRIGILGNAFLLWQIFFGVWDMLPEYFQWYLNIGTLVAIIAVISYLLKEKLPSEFYDLCFVAYGSLSILFVIIFALELGIPRF